MFTERGEASQHATIFAYHPQATFSTFQWLVIDLNFTTLELEQCNHDDYYLWKPTDEVLIHPLATPHTGHTPLMNNK